MMLRARRLRHLLNAATILSGCLAAAAHATPPNGAQMVPSGQLVTPTAAPGAVFQDLNPMLPDHPDYRAGQAIKTVISPDGSTLLTMTSGFNNLAGSRNTGGKDYAQLEPSASMEYVFVYDISGSHAGAPQLKQIIKVPDTFVGLVFSPDGSKFYVSGGVDDVVYTYATSNAGWTKTAEIHLHHSVIAGTPDNGGIGFFQSPSVANLALSASGNILAAVNIYNDSISLIDTQTNKVTSEYDLRPYHTTPAAGQGLAGGETPFGVAIRGDRTIYVSSIRDREVVVLDISSGKPQLVTRIPMTGNPNSMVFDNAANPTKLYVTQDNTDYVAVINLSNNAVIEQIDAIGPAGITPSVERYTGAASNNLAISPNGRMLYVTNGGQNALAVIPLTGPIPHQAAGLIPTGWYPQAVSVSHDGRVLYIANGKSDPGPNPDHLTSSTYALTGTHYIGGNDAASNAANASNQYVFQLEKAGLLAVPVPSATDLATLTTNVAANNAYDAHESMASRQTMAALSQNITHVIYIVKENRTYDQVLGDLGTGANGQPDLTVFGKRVTPNFHRAAAGFVTLDNFLDPGEVSGNGWEWSVSARETDLNTKQIPLDYANSPKPTALNQGYRGAPYNAEGQNNDVDVGIPTIPLRTVAEPLYPAVTSLFPGGTKNFMPGTNNDAAPDGPNGQTQMGYIWDSAVHAGLTVRNYGFYIDLGGNYALDPTPFADSAIQAYPTNPTLLTRTDQYFRSFDNRYPDFYRFNEWNREFAQFVANKDLPALSFVRFMHDHMGNFSNAIGGINTPETQQADNDYACGLLLQTIAHSPYAGNTLVFIVEDDSQDGPDHVDAHRSTAYVVGPYVKHGAVISDRYTTVNMLRTIEDILGIDHLNLNDAYAKPMADLFDLSQSKWTFKAAASPYLRGTADDTAGTTFADLLAANPVHPAAWWAEKTKGFNWSREDAIPSDLFNRIVWQGFKGDAPYPARRGPATAPHQDHDDD